MPSTSTRTVLIVEDDAGVAELERLRLEAAGYTALTATSAAEAMQILARNGISLILLDYRLPGDLNGLDFFAHAKAAGYNVPVILVTGFSNEATVIQALRIGVRDIVTKSIEYLDYLPEAVHRVLRQVETESELAESEARLASVIRSAKDAIIVTDQREHITLFNPAAESMFQTTAQNALGQRLSKFIPPELATERADATGDSSLSVRLRAGKRGIRASGEEFPIEASVSRAQVGDRRICTIVVRDITERKKAEERFRALLESAPDAMVLVNRHGKIALVNGRTETIFGYSREELLNQPVEMLLPERYRNGHPDLREQFFAAPNWRPMRSGPTLFGRNRDGREFPVEISLNPLTTDEGVFAVSTIRDITARKNLEDQFRQAQKMEAIGRLAGGVAHDFNNLLTVINGYTEIMLMKTRNEDPFHSPLSEIRKAGERASNLTRQLLAFSRKAIVVSTVLDLNALISDMERMLLRLIGEDIQWHFKPDRELWPVLGDPGQMEQVVMNLVVNARDAMERGGKLTVETHNVVLDAAYAATHTDAKAGEYVQFVVTDTGCGMDAATRAHIFEPFFTTKGSRGTGLGLATVFGIVKQSGGHIEVYSEVGHGTAVKVYLPREARRTPSKRPPSSESVRPKGTETILIVEDEDGVRSLGREILMAHGYTVLDARNGQEALDLCERYGTEISLLMTDVVMPVMSGRELFEKVRAKRPGIRVLFVSGYTDEAVVRHGVLDASTPFLQKPFGPDSLARKVREVIDKHAN